MKNRVRKYGAAILCFICVLLFAVFTVIAGNIRTTYELGLGSSSKMLTSFLKVIFWIMMSYAAFWGLNKLESFAADKDARSVDRRRFRPLKTAVILFVIYLIWLLIFYPGLCNWDTINQIYDLKTGMQPMPFSWVKGQPTISALLNDHHPVFDTLIFYGFYHVGEIFGHNTLGFFAYGLCQIALSSIAFTWMIETIDRFDLPSLYHRAGFLYLAAFPPIAHLAICMLKDSLFSMIFVFYFVNWVLIIKDHADLKRMVILIITSLLLALTKKTGIYLVIFSNVFLIFIKPVRKHVITWTLSFILPAVTIFVLFSKILFPAFQIYPGGPQEMLSSPLQQVALVYIETPESFSKEELRILDRIVPLKAIKENYDPGITDGIKDQYNFDATDDDRSAFIRLWISKLFSRPDICIRAVFSAVGGYYAPTDDTWYVTSLPNQTMLGVNSPTKTAFLREGVDSFYEWLRALPGLGLIFRVCIYDFWLPLLAFYVLCKEKNPSGFICLIPAILSAGVLLLSPCHDMRYALPLIYTAPLIFAMTCTQFHKKN